MEEEKVLTFDNKKFFTVLEFYDLIDHAITKTQIYRMCKEGKVPCKRLGSKVLISGKWVRDFFTDPMFEKEA